MNHSATLSMLALALLTCLPMGIHRTTAHGAEGRGA